jgi:hypothetical protein
MLLQELIQSVKGDDSDDWRLPNPSTRFDELLARLCRKDHKKRSVGKIHFSLGDGVKFGVAVYNLIRYSPVVCWLMTFIFMCSLLKVHEHAMEKSVHLPAHFNSEI